MRKPAFCICKNKDADQLCSNGEADQRLCFCYKDSTIPLLPKIQNFKPLTIFCGCTARLVSDLVGTPEDRFSHNEAQILQNKLADEIIHTQVINEIILQGNDRLPVSTLKFLNFWTLEILTVIYLKFKKRGQTFGYFVKKMQME